MGAGFRGCVASRLVASIPARQLIAVRAAALIRRSGVNSDASPDSRTGRSFPSCDGSGRSPVAGSLLAAIELAFDSKVCSFGFSADSLEGAVSMNGGFFGTSGRRGRGQIDDGELNRFVLKRKSGGKRTAEGGEGKSDHEVQEERDHNRQSQVSGALLFVPSFSETA